MEISDIKFKDDLRKELLLYRQMTELLDGGEIEKLRRLIEKNIERVNASLQD